MLTSAKTLEGATLPDPCVRHEGLRRRRPGREADVMASNGIIHVINKVLIPPKQ